MVDNMNPTSQFHPYQPPDATPNAEKLSSSTGGLGGILNKIGIDPNSISSLGSMINGTNMRGQLDKARGMARSNPGMVLGGLAALVIGAGLMRRRR